MILSLTPNPSTDITLATSTALAVGDVQRLAHVSTLPGGKGINVTHCVHNAGASSKALFPADPQDLYLRLLKVAGIPFEVVPTVQPVRINTSICEPDGTTTKLNGPGSVLDGPARAAVQDILAHRAATADWVVLAGSLPPGAPKGWYADLIETVRMANPAARIAVDTSDGPLVDLIERLPGAAPDVLTPNGMELASCLPGLPTDPHELEQRALAGDFAPAAHAARKLLARGIPRILVTLGQAGAVLVTHHGAWRATPPQVTVRSTVGAGDCALAGFLLGLGRSKGNDEYALRTAVAYGAAAAALPATEIPSPADVHVEQALTEPITLS